MKLDAVELAGFKSFADRTKIRLDKELTAIVGPNGCGKSNLIDAIRWVIGERNARNLRAATGTDVIFKGTQRRAPLAFSSVTLHFSDCLGELPGDLSQYHELNIRRQIDREGQSSYFINNTHCRRKDVVDLFLGTGLGPNHYAIIGQGTVSQIAEAKPDQLRRTLEEVAGIAKYKDRKAETERRIKQTGENAQRLQDIIDELAKQLQHIKRQAEVAKRYKRLKKEVHDIKYQLLESAWCTYEQQRVGLENNRLSLAAEKEDAKIEHWQKQAEYDQMKEAMHGAREQLASSQKAYYQACQDMAEQQQKKQSVHETLARLQKQKGELSDELSRQAKRIANDRQAYATADRQLLEKRARHRELQNILAQGKKRYQSAKTQMDDHEQIWHKASEKLAKMQQKSNEIEKQFQSQKRKMNPIKEQCNLVEAALAEHDGTKVEQRVKVCRAEMSEISQAIAALQGIQKKAAEKRHLAQQTYESLSEQSNLQFTELNGLSKQLHMLESLCKADYSSVQSWLDKHNLAGVSLASQLTISQDWLIAVNHVMQDFSKGMSIADEDRLIKCLDEDFTENIICVSQLIEKKVNNIKDKVPLATHVKGSESIAFLFAEVFCCESIEEGMHARSSLEEHQSLILQDGTWIGKQWIRTPPAGRDHALLRTQQLRSLRAEHSRLSESYALADKALKQSQSTLDDLKQDCSDLDSQAIQLAEKSSELQVKIIAMEAESEKMILIQSSLEDKRSDLAKSLLEIEQSNQALQAQREQEHERIAHASAEHDDAKSAYLRSKQVFSILQARESQTACEHHGLETALLALEKNHVLLKRHLDDYHQQSLQGKEKTEVLENEIRACHEDAKLNQSALEALQTSRSASEAVHQAADQKMRALEAKVASMEGWLREKQSGHQSLMEASACAELALQQCLDYQAHLVEQGEAMLGKPFVLPFNKLDEPCDVGALEKQRDRIQNRLKRMGPINLAAIDEVEAIENRYQDLSNQHQDLCRAVSTLQEAIATIDQETKQKFKHAYEHVSAAFSTIFPQLFKGGRGRLSMLDDNILTSGIKMIAQPAGKQNTSIHLLSGGEKTLTALAFLFALFAYKPAPFCLMDEVDAPLDDNNVILFNKMIKSLSDKIQFVVITHNKKSIASSKQMIGITMSEPGVSRQVSVNMDAALAMVES